MEKLTVSDAITSVRRAIDEIQINDAGFDGLTDTDSSDLDDIIEGNLVQAVRHVHSQCAARHLYRQAMQLDVSSGCTVTGTGHDIVEIRIPSLLRLVNVRMKDSEYGVSDIFEANSPMAMMQNDRYVRGTYERPALVWCHSSGDDAVIRYYSLSESAEGKQVTDVVDEVLYMPEPAIEGADADAHVMIAGQLRNAVLNHLAGLTLLVYKDGHADSFFNLAKNDMQ